MKFLQRTWLQRFQSNNEISIIKYIVYPWFKIIIKLHFFINHTYDRLDHNDSSTHDSWSPGMHAATGTAAGEGGGGQLNEFIEGLGPGQLVGRQVLGAPSLGDIQLTLRNDKGYLEVEVVRARDLQPRAGSKVLPGMMIFLAFFSFFFHIGLILYPCSTFLAPYVKVYLVNGKKCIAKAKTTVARKTLEPMYQQPLAFRENFQGCILQVGWFFRIYVWCND